MRLNSLPCVSVLVLLCFNGAIAEPQHSRSDAQSTKPLVKRPAGTTFKTMLAADGGGVRGLMSTMVLMEAEQSIKRYLLKHPAYLPAGTEIATADDFDVNLVDYFDCMIGSGGGVWTTLYLASRGGQGVSRNVLDDPAIVEKYGFIPNGAAAGLKVFYDAYTTAIFPPEAIDPDAGSVKDLTNLNVQGVSHTIYPLDGVEATLQAFYGDTTLVDFDTSVLIPAYDLISGQAILFVQDAFRDRPVTSSARMVPRIGPKTSPADASAFAPDLEFDEGKDYYLRDIGAGATNPPVYHPPKSVSQVGNNGAEEFALVDGIMSIDDLGIAASFFVVRENGLRGLEDIAVLSIGNGRLEVDLSELADAGAAGWLRSFTLMSLYDTSERQGEVAMLDYLFYVNPETKPNQYLRIQMSAPEMTEVATALSSFSRAEFLDVYEELGKTMAESHREAIDDFVESFIFA